MRDGTPAQLLQRFSWKRLDSRRLQQELDTHRLLLLTEHYARTSTGPDVLIYAHKTTAARADGQSSVRVTCMHAHDGRYL